MMMKRWMNADDRQKAAMKKRMTMWWNKMDEDQQAEWKGMMKKAYEGMDEEQQAKAKKIYAEHFGKKEEGEVTKEEGENYMSNKFKSWGKGEE